MKTAPNFGAALGKMFLLDTVWYSHHSARDEMVGYFIYVQCPKCSHEWGFGYTHNKVAVGSPTLNTVQCEMCLEDVFAIITRLVPKESDESDDQSPIKGGWD
jgi:ribosomal protein S27E